MGSHHPFALAAGLLAIASPALAGPGHDLPSSPPSGDLPGGPEGPAAAEPGDAPGTLAVVDGVVQSVDLAGHRITLDVKGTPLVLGVDRNTLVYLPTGLSTVFELRPGEIVRASRNDRSVAFWLQVRPPPPTGGAPSSTPGQGTGPGGGAAPAAEGNDSASHPGPPAGAPGASPPGPG